MKIIVILLILHGDGAPAVNVNSEFHKNVSLIISRIDISNVSDVDRLFHFYYESLSRLYSKRSELATIHFHSHLFNQVQYHGALCFTSCFARESYLAHVLRLCKGKTYVLNQLVTWYERRSTINLLISDQKTRLRDIYIRNQHQILTIRCVSE